MKRLILILFSLFVSWSSFAQWNGFVTNHRKEEFGRGSKTWQIRAYDENHIYFANKNGVLEYNGTDWSLLPLDNKNDVRSVCISQKHHRVYAGGEGEFGYFEPDERGRMTYTNLSATFLPENGTNGGYWGVFEVDNLIYYVSDRHIIKQIDNDFTTIYSDRKIDCSNIVNGILYIGTTDGVKMLVGNTLLPIPQDELLKGKTVRAIAPYESGFLIATAFNGLYYGSEAEVTPFHTGVEDFMRQNEVFSLATSPGYIAIGTIHKGLILIDENKRRISYYNEQNGLQNNTILSLYFDFHNDLWLGLDNGIDYISLNSAISNLYTYPSSYGAGYDVLLHDNCIFLATNRGLFYADTPVVMDDNAPSFQMVPGLSGQVWGIEKVDGEIFCLHEKGLYLVGQNRAELIPGLRGALFCSEIDKPGFCLVGTYEGLFLLEKEQGKWSIRKKLTDDTQTWIKNAVFIAPTTIWIRTIDLGMTRIKVDTADFSVIESKLYNTSNGFTSIDHLFVHKMKGEAYFSTASGWYAYDQSKDSIVAVEELSSIFLPGELYSNLVSKGDQLFALSEDILQVARLQPGDEKSEVKLFPFSKSQIETISYYESMEVLNDSLVIIPNEHGFALLNVNVSHKKKDRNELFIKNVFITYPKDTLIYTDNYLHRLAVPEIRYKRNALRFEYEVRAFGNNNPVMYRVRLYPDNVWSDYSLSTVKEYNNLKEGSYTFEVEALFADGNKSYKSYEFRILPPWYRSGYAWAGYLLLFVLFFFAVYKYDDKRIERKRKAEAAKKEEEMHLREQEFQQESFRKEQEIIELKNEKLEQELTFKSQEMANLMINFSRKNEILMHIKQELYKVTSEMKGDDFAKAKRMLLAINSSIDLNIQSDDALKRFEEQFNLVHNNFMKKLREKYPDLSVSELKMCAYIRMNLSTKEVAPLLNLSVRGVETIRYRLRKKIGLERDESLTEYLNTFS
ncbi:DNA-binding CsgD family transcriptional regulator [Parabacteroides sp. PF5-5]|uniref:helix-turn-helix and ligand-binding sensor domain-containing protein n=1 Tax=unclassified Parabacteroides TaxID=2649774 RepID=UPI00247397B7|nr:MULTISPECIES: triple tyrosine motif-containing protein [unclassified Parabacteroides]MDH6305068.1 DNA-binding CsgD family transcriptional regulator [Parabacteroides sp. PH5-39]MDH6315847.1 DNA-binding CsgD family transcriptional regulator [Parabacteroides sp. PF5-13]MDH6319504.1 DNA-binding CsgD family transcriptional regulator [Parabacteroides sp. PH5-13]MDH6323235.1 DNA-binding CsgD family transcriptional regulator [Parabacteroides sp. PH5-8]MDH6327257.1 DNA-binding CsgD family transcript